VRGESAADKAYAPRTIAPTIDTDRRPRVRNRDGSVSTVRSIGITSQGREVLIPTIVGGKRVSDREAVRHYERTGQHLGIYPTRAASDRAGRELHAREQRRVAALEREDARTLARRKLSVKQGIRQPFNERGRGLTPANPYRPTREALAEAQRQERGLYDQGVRNKQPIADFVARAALETLKMTHPGLLPGQISEFVKQQIGRASCRERV